MTAALRAHMRRLREGEDSGMTLVELVVVIGLMGALGAMLSTWFITTTRTTNGYTGRITDINDARVAMDRMSRDLRMAISPSPGVDAFDASSNGSLVTAYVNQPTGAPSRVTYQLVDNGDGTTRLTRSTTPAVGTSPPFTWPTGGTTTQVLAQTLVQGSTLLFAYYDVGSAALPTCASGAESPCATPMAASPSIASPGSVGSVEITLRAQSGNAAPATELNTRVRVANAGLTAIV